MFNFLLTKREISVRMVFNLSNIYRYYVGFLQGHEYFIHYNNMQEIINIKIKIKNVMQMLNQMQMFLFKNAQYLKFTQVVNQLYLIFSVYQIDSTYFRYSSIVHITTLKKKTVLWLLILSLLVLIKLCHRFITWLIYIFFIYIIYP